MLFFVLLSTFLANAEVRLHDSRVWTRAKIVAGGQHVWSLQSSYRRTDNKFSDDGKVQALGKGYERAITWGRVLRAQRSQAGRADVQSAMATQGAQETDIAATSSYDIEHEDVGLGIDWAYGITKNWMIGFQVPLTHRRTQVKSNFSGASAGKVQAMATDELSSSGYDGIPESKESWEWGDINLLSQFYLLDDYDWDWSLQQIVRFPASRTPDVADYLAPMTDDGQIDVGIATLLDYKYRRMTLGWRLGYVAQLPDSARMRVSEENEDADIDPKVNRDLGDWVWGSFEIDYRVLRNISFEVEYGYLNKAQDRYKAADRDFTELERLTDQELHQTRVGLNYQIASTSARRGVENKWMAAFGYTHPWTGRNASDAGRTSLELISYF